MSTLGKASDLHSNATYTSASRTNDPPPPYEEMEGTPDPPWAFLLKQLNYLLTPYQIVQGPLLVCKAWYRYLSSQLYQNVHIYSYLHYLSLTQALAMPTVPSPGQSLPFSLRLTSLHLHGKDWETALSLLLFSSDTPANQDPWLSTLLIGLQCLRSLELDSVPFLTDKAVLHLSNTWRQHIESAPSTARDLKHLRLRRAMHLSGNSLVLLLSTLYACGTLSLETLGLSHCPGLNGGFLKQAVDSSWWGWCGTLRTLLLDDNASRLTPGFVNAVFDRNVFSTLHTLSLAHAAHLPPACVYRLLAKTPVVHLEVDGLQHASDSPVPASLIEKWEVLSARQCAVPWLRAVLAARPVRLRRLVISPEMLTAPELVATNLPALHCLVVEETQGDGVPVDLLRPHMGLSTTALSALCPQIIVKQPRRLASYLDAMLTRAKAKDLVRESNGKCFLELFERDTVSEW